MKKFLFTSMIFTLLLIMCMPTMAFGGEVITSKSEKIFFTDSNGVISWQVRKVTTYQENIPGKGYVTTDTKYEDIEADYYRINIYDNVPVTGNTYHLQFRDEKYTSKSFDYQKIFDSLSKNSGRYYFEITAIGCDAPSNNCWFQYSQSLDELSAPTNLRWDGKIARWDSVENATQYTVHLESETGGGKVTKDTSNPYYDFSKISGTSLEDGDRFSVYATANGYADSETAKSTKYKASNEPTTTSVSEVQFENFTWLTNGQEYTQSNPKAILKSDFPGTITKQVIKINGKVMEADTTAGDNIELAVYIKLNDGYTWNSSVNAWLDGKVEDDFLKISSMGENERVFIWKHTTEYTDKIKITEQSPETLEYTNGEDVKLYVKATGASNYQWSMYEERGVGIKTVRGFYKIDGATSNEYIIKNADSSLDGKEYRCTLAVDDATIFTKTITLKLVEKKTEEPAKTEQPTKTDEPTKTEEPAKTEEPTKTEEPVKTDEPTTEKTWTKASDWAEEELVKANKLDVIPEIFKKQDLTQNITRKEFAHVAVKLYEKLTGNKATAVANNPFKDTDDVEVLKAYNVGITQGTGADTFTPDALITREQMATMMTRALTKAGIDTKVDLEKVTKFADDAEMHDWGKASIYYMSSIEIIKGVGNNTFNVLGNATREQALLISERSAEKFAK